MGIKNMNGVDVVSFMGNHKVALDWTAMAAGEKSHEHSKPANHGGWKSGAMLHSKTLAMKEAQRFAVKTGCKDKSWYAGFKWPTTCSVTGRDMNYGTLGHEDRPVIIRKDFSKPWAADNLRVLTNWAFVRGLHYEPIAAVVRALQAANKVTAVVP